MAKTMFKFTRPAEPRPQTRYKVVARNDREAQAVMRKHFPQDAWFDESRRDRQQVEKFDEREVLS